jgi:hypothetical protein
MDRFLLLTWHMDADRRIEPGIIPRRLSSKDRFAERRIEVPCAGNIVHLCGLRKVITEKTIEVRKIVHAGNLRLRTSTPGSLVLVAADGDDDSEVTTFVADECDVVGTGNVETDAMEGKIGEKEEPKLSLEWLLSLSPQIS